MNRRDFVAAVAGTAFANAVSSNAWSATALTWQPKIDSLCYTTKTITPGDIDMALAGGLDAAVLDISAYPREPEEADAELKRWQGRFKDPAMRVFPILRGADFASARQSSKLGIVFACQDASILGSGGGDFEARAENVHAAGLRVLQLTHNNRTSFADSFMEPRDGGLSLAGQALVAKLNALRIAIDLSHCSPLTLHETVDRSSRPCLITHAGCYVLAPTRRNKTDEEIRHFGKRGGYFGVFGVTTWLTEGPTASIATVLDHIDHVVQLIGPDHVGFGSDGGLAGLDAVAETEHMTMVQKMHAGGPSAEWPVNHTRVPALNRGDRILRLGEGLSTRKYSDDQIAGILGGNFAGIFTSVCG